ncbi:MAG TPA: DUF5666 domain-containing protein [Chloroflexota bacterium]|nr:DUF5666 domain-containing protein [Chloroflexota bacterium]
MSRSRVIGYTILAVALLVVGAQAVFASADSAPTRALAITPTAATQGQDWNIDGTIQAMNGEFWNIQGFAVRVDSTTPISGDLPAIGSYVQASGTVQADGTWLVKDLRVGHGSAAPTSTATSTAMPTDTPAPAAADVAATDESTPTATPTDTPAEPAYVVPTAPAHISIPISVSVSVPASQTSLTNHRDDHHDHHDQRQK